MTAFFIHLHIVNMRDVKNIMKITNSKKISVVLKMVRIIQKDFGFSYLCIWSMALESWKYISNRE